MVLKVVNTKTNILITGETGTGKDLIARTIHHNSNRSSGPFIPVDCVVVNLEKYLI